ncbi:MAG: phenylalanine--tRNA ligase subunit alpha, partial [Bacteroidetes bacterium]|nr:phenylalanine--tRNA ligase subunit alpha [Bacteroidota bacterium]
CFFHQLEGLYIDQEVSFADLKQTLYYFIQKLFGENTKVRFRPSYFPFTEPSAEMDVWVGTDTEDDYRLTKGTGWLEILGCGMVHPNVLQNCSIDPEIYSGFAFGLGLDRICMLRYGVKDIREFFSGDIRFLKQFASL